MAYLHDNVLDNGIQYIDTNISDVFICSGAVTTYTQATSSSALGSFGSPVCSAPQDGAINGRRVVISAIASGSVTGTGTASHWAVVYDSASILMASGSLTSSQAVTTGNSFSLTEFDIEIPDAP